MEQSKSYNVVIEPIKHYSVLENVSLKKLIEIVNFMIQQGWEPLGNISAINISENKSSFFALASSREIKYLQAMVIRKEWEITPNYLDGLKQLDKRLSNK